jgi:ribosomal protein S18 acetylase RimI-like enzyme
MQIRAIEAADINAVASLFRALAIEFIVHESPPEAACTFLRENDAEAIRAYIDKGYVYHVAVSGGEIAGFVAVRERSHLFHLFVAKAWQRRGLARRLWQQARRQAIEDGGDGRFTVNSSNYALPLYHALGFVRTASMQCNNGLYFNPMALAEHEKK